MKVFLDNNISHNTCSAIRALVSETGDEVVHLTDRFSADTKDTEWIAALSDEGGWVVVSADARISRSKIEKKAWQESGLTIFFLDGSWANKKLMKQSAELIRWWDTIRLSAKSALPGTGFRLPFGGKKPKLMYEPGE